ncbi:Uncharacterized conserved protein, DUF885 familyt [Amycolatopsis arida]|uniref:Uncharacterized conserved protein, DUF885 familyt n=1 Tax=Amycolatopsis arida TaxID=587909 RepID=A0A1I5XIX6_9PSEU|nr:DUF885 domain-containing protein [Amycolatopsis arida]TDX97426.1 uncharacterized protein (DUF885 family) [Amycolatopsis arida]SFQ31756.1 Uncharacterized conserved protein, DUF885 familyt [Amycolatopsis arida]
MSETVSTADRLADECLDLLFRVDPLWPSLLGVPGEHDRLLPDHAAATAARNRAAFADLAARAEALDAETLSERDVVTRDVVIQQARVAIDLVDSRGVEIAVSDTLDAPVQRLVSVLPMISLTDTAKAEGYLNRLAAVGSYVDTTIERQRVGAADGLLPPGFLVEAGIAWADRYLADLAADPLRLAAEVDVPGFAAERDRLLTDVVRPAVRRYREFLAGELRPRALPADRPGLCWLPGGEEAYAALLRVHTSTDRGARELHDIGLRLVEELAAEYREVGSRVFGSTDLGEIFTRLRTDPALRWRDADELLDAARSAIARAEAVASKWFGRIPPQRCAVLPVPESEAEDGTIAYYVEPALDGSRPGRYYANTHRAAERSRHTSEAIAFHEAVPGHHFQLSTALGLTELPLLRRVADVNAYTEGWGLYSERLADEMGLYSDDVARLGMLTQDSMRAARLVVDTGLHALGWSRERAVEYFRENVPMPPLEIEAEIDRYAGLPAQAVSYMVGRLEIERLRGMAERELGPVFDIRRFHDVVLGGGNLPLSVLDTVVRDWVASQRG